ncbi:IS1 family transposase [Moheibacter sediminis]|uniref:Transposase and inactivated derivatives, IS1 family n=1 Tax=Moheibacter sediminis TaxID=1434700 RepID=A0A1W2BBP4_9FLAO|nr:IS1 family transposase [Moheibacter sediminis]SMC70190.1 Transposase and inactivated derivatives, IS1 family [Moheibacter sediminis]
MKTETKCFKVSDTVICPNCKANQIIKNGKTKTGKQQFLCKSCKKRFIDFYTYNAYQTDLNQQIIILTKEGLGIRSTARVLNISTTTLLKRILSISRNIKPPIISMRKEYEVDELCTYIGSKQRRIWIVCALERISKGIVSFNIGRRTNQTLKSVISTLNLSKAKFIYTDELKNYKFLIEKNIHKVKRFGTNSIERKHLTLRTHLKRLNRRTICFSRSTIILNSIMKIYFWG